MPVKKSAARSREALLAAIKLIVLDVDGVLTDGRIIYDENGVEHKSFDVHDGFGIRQAKASGIHIALISGRRSKIVTRRAAELGIDEVHQGVDDKRKSLDLLLRKYRLTASEVCAVGDDLPDLPILTKAGFSAAPSSAVAEVRHSVDYVSKRGGGRGAVREILDLIASAKRTRVR